MVRYLSDPVTSKVTKKLTDSVRFLVDTKPFNPVELNIIQKNQRYSKYPKTIT